MIIHRAQSGPEGPARAERAESQGHSVLVAEDDEDMRELLAQMFRRDGVRVIEAPDGGALLERLLAPPPGDRVGFDLLVTDVNMPRFGGLEALEALRGARLGTPVIVMSGFVDASMRARVRSLGGWLLEKPFALDRLRELAGALLAAGPA